MDIVAFVNEGNVFFRAPLLLALVWFMWGVNVLIFERVKIDYASVLDFDRTSTLRALSICKSALVFFGLTIGCWFLYTIKWPFEDALVIPSVMYMVFLFVLLIPLDVFHRKGREKLVKTLVRVCLPSPLGVHFAEVVLGDILTSLSKTLADLQVSLCMLVGHSLKEDVDADGNLMALGGTLQQNCSASLLRPLVTSLPFLLRFRQCIVAYRATGKAFPHLVNAAKYASALPVILISTFAHVFPAQYGLFLRKVWLVAITFNSFFSFIWDVVMDWGLFRSDTYYVFLRPRLLYMSASQNQYMRVETCEDELPSALPKVLKSKASDQSIDLEKAEEWESNMRPSEEKEAPGALGTTTPRSLDVDANLDKVVETASALTGSSSELSHRRIPEALSIDTGELNRPASRYEPLLPHTPILYYVAILLDFLLRVLWSFKLSVHLHLTQEGLTFVLEICEVLRRHLWLVFRIEWQIIVQEDSEKLESPSSRETEMSPEEHSPQVLSASQVWAKKTGVDAGPLRSRASSDRTSARVTDTGAGRMSPPISGFERR